MNNSKFVGSTMILVGSIIGAGMLALPAVSAAAGFTVTTLLMIVIWLVSTVTGLLILEVNMILPSDACTFSSMAKHTLGRVGEAITWLFYLFLLYAIITAYVIGASGFITNNIAPLLHINIPSWLSSVVFTVVFGTAVFWSTEAVDYFNRFLLSLKGILLISTLIFILPYISADKLVCVPSTKQISNLWLAIPAFICAFSYHFVIPSIRIYIGENPHQVKKIIIAGTSVSFLIYFWWLAAALGTIPITGEHSFTSMGNDPPPSLLITTITFLINNNLVATCIQGFANIALTSSFLCVAIGLFDFLADGFRRPNTRLGRLQTTGLTFIPPLLTAIFYPQGFYKAITFSSISVATLSLILPTLMVYNLRKNKEYMSTSSYKAKCNNIVILLIFLFGLAAIGSAIVYITL